MGSGIRLPVVLMVFVTGVTALACLRLSMDNASVRGATAAPAALVGEAWMRQERLDLGMADRSDDYDERRSVVDAQQALLVAESDAGPDAETNIDQEPDPDVNEDEDESEVDTATVEAAEEAEQALEDPGSSSGASSISTSASASASTRRSLVPAAQLAPKLKKTFAYNRGACNYYCRVLKQAGYKQVPGVGAPVRPEMVLISYKSLAKYSNIKSSLLNQVGYGSACIGGGKGKQLSCKEDFAKENGCEYQSLGVQPVQWNIRYEGACRAFFLEAAKPENARQIWIVKPGGSFHGSGIKLYEGVAKLSSLYSCEGQLGDGLIVQRYVSKPALFTGNKFDFRTYMLIASMDPYIVFAHDGFVRRSEHAYDTAGASLTDTKTHITNAKSQSMDNHFFSFEQLQQRLSAESGFAPDYMENVFRPHARRATLFMFESAKRKFAHRKGRFQVFALDWMIDADGGMHLLEANGNPQVSSYPLPDLTPALWTTMHDVVHAVHVEPETLPQDGSFSVRDRYRFGGWHMVYNELELEAEGKNYNPCLFNTYRDQNDPLFGFVPPID